MEIGSATQDGSILIAWRHDPKLYEKQLTTEGEIKECDGIRSGHQLFVASQVLQLQSTALVPVCLVCASA